jgi:hypothetical protein
MNISGFHYSFSPNHLPITHKKQHGYQYQSIIVKHSKQIINETIITEQITQIPYYSLFFSILEKHTPLNIHNTNDTNDTNINNTEKYYLFTYDNKCDIPMMEYFYSISNIKQLIFVSIRSFSYLLHSLSLLHNNNICLFNVSPENIVYQLESGENPLIKNFRSSLLTQSFHISSLCTSVNGLSNFTYQPLEIHILYYLIKYDMNTISYSFIEEFCETFISNLHILKLKLFTEQYKQSYKEQCIYIMKQYVNKSKNEIIHDIWNKHNKWDVYGISVIYIQIFYSICITFTLNQTFFNTIVMKLSQNIHPDSNYRMTLERTIQIFNECFDKQKDWYFANQLEQSNDKMQELFDTFSC